MPDATRFAATPQPPYFAVLFTSQRSATDAPGYAAMAERMEALAAMQPGFLGIESARDEGGVGITVSYWASEEAIVQWKADVDHLVAQQLGRARWYEHFEVRVAKVERAYRFSAPSPT